MQYKTVYSLIKCIYNSGVAVPSIDMIVDLVDIPISGRFFSTKDKEVLVIVTTKMKAQFSARKYHRILVWDLNQIILALKIHRGKRYQGSEYDLV